MAHSAVVQKSEEKEEVSVEFVYYALLTDKSTYYRWRHVGTQHSLVTDEEIACFLLKCYEKKAGVPSAGDVCTTCRSLLKLCCLSCGEVNAPATSAAICVAEQTAKLPDAAEEDGVSVIRAEAAEDCPLVSQDLTESNPHQGMNLRSRRRLGQMCQQQSQAPKRRKTTSAAPKIGRSEQNLKVTQNTSSAVREQPDLFSSLELSTETWKLAEEKNREVEDDEESCSPLPDHEQIAESKENAESFQSSDRPRAGRGRPRKYPPISLECSVCHRKLSTRASVVNHMRKKHPDCRPVEVCDTITSPPSLKTEPVQERLNTDTEVDGTEGEADNSSEESRPRKPYVTEAMKRLRKAELETLKCATCGAQFEHKRQMYTHRRLCVSKVCHLCGRSVKQLEMHLKRHSSARRFPCPHCPKSFLFRNYLQQHLLYHSNEKPYCCEICGVRYREKTRLNAHIRTHTGSKPYKCELCQAAFTRPRGLNDHMRVHTGEKPYSCQVCGRHFSSSGNLAAHRRKVHGLQPQVPNRMTRKLFEVDAASSHPGKGGSSEVADVPECRRDGDKAESEAVTSEGVSVGCEEASCSGDGVVHAGLSCDFALEADPPGRDRGSGQTPALLSTAIKEAFLLNGAHVPTNAPPVSTLTGADVPEPVVMSGISVSAGVLVGVPPRSVIPVSSGGSVAPPAVLVSADIPVSPADGVHRSPLLVPAGSAVASSGLTLNSSSLGNAASPFPTVRLNL